MDFSRVSTFGARKLAVWIIAATKGTSPSSIARIDGFRIDPARAPLRVFPWDQIMPLVPDAWSNYWQAARSGREEPRRRMRLLASRVMASLPNPPGPRIYVRTWISGPGRPYLGAGLHGAERNQAT